MSNDLLVLVLLSPLIFFLVWDLFSIVRVRFTKFDRSELFPDWTDYWDSEAASYVGEEYTGERPKPERKQRWYDFM